LKIEDFNGKTTGKSWKNHGTSMEINGKSMDNPWKIHGKIWVINYYRLAEGDRKMVRECFEH
jgi:uncharacterized protein YxjI